MPVGDPQPHSLVQFMAHKSRQHGLRAVVDSEETFVRLLGRFRRERVVP